MDSVCCTRLEASIPDERDGPVAMLLVLDGLSTNQVSQHYQSAHYDPDLNPAFYNFALHLRLRHRAQHGLQAES